MLVIWFCKIEVGHALNLKIGREAKAVVLIVLSCTDGAEDRYQASIQLCSMKKLVVI